MFKAKTKVLIGNLSCSHLKEAHPNATSGNYTIDPDGSRGEDPFTVFCDMSHNYEVGVTVVSHDSEGPTKLTEKLSCDTWDERTVTYFGASVSKLGKLADVSTHCEQFVKFECLGEARCWRELHSYWLSRDGKLMFYWGGATPGRWMCACGMSGTCTGGAGCNCNYWSSGPCEDSGLLTDKNNLPVTKLRLAPFFIRSSYAVGKFKCKGTFNNAGNLEVLYNDNNNTNNNNKSNKNNNDNNINNDSNSNNNDNDR